MKRDTFVNLDLLYEQLDKPLEELDTKVFWAKRWLDEEYASSQWIPARVERNIDRSMQESQEALSLISEIKEILAQFKKDSLEKPERISCESSSPRIKHMKVIMGGLYHGPEKIERRV